MHHQANHQAASAHSLAQDDRLASVYLQSRLRELAALQQELADPNNGYATVSRSEIGIEIRTRTETVIAVSMTAAQAFVLRRFW